MAVATFEDVAVAVGRPITDVNEQNRVTYWLDAAELQIQARLGPVADLDQAAVKYVETEVAVARLQNPDGVQYEAIDDYRYGLPAESRRIIIRPEWWALLGDSGGAFTITPSYVPDDPASMAAWYEVQQ